MVNNPQMLHAAQSGWDAIPPFNPHLWSSACWMAYKAGEALRAHGQPKPVKASMSRGFSVRIYTGVQEEIIKFEGDNLERMVF